MTIATVFDVYPSLTETFLARELQALRGEGLRVLCCALRRPDLFAGPVPENTLDARYAFSGACESGTPRRNDARPTSALRVSRALGSVFALAARSVPGGLRLLRRLPYALSLSRNIRHEGVTHVHAHFATMPCEAGLLMADLLGCPFSFSVHARDIYVRPGRALPWKASRAAFVVACTSHARQRLLQLAPDLEAKRVFTMYHGVDPDRYPESRPEGTMILAVGRLVPKKGFHVLIDACRLLKEQGRELRLVIVGAGPERDRLRARVARAGLQDVIEWRGALLPDQVAALLHRARVLAAPSVEAPDGDRDGIANVLLEAMACGVPVVTTTGSAACEAVDDGVQGFLIPPGDSAELARCMERVLQDPVLARRLGQAGRQRVAERFDIHKNIQMLVRLFDGNAKET